MELDDHERTAAGGGAEEREIGRSIFLRHAVRRPGFLVASLIIGFVVGLAYRATFDDADSRDVANYLRSGFHGVGIAWAGWAVQTGFASGARSRLGAALKRLPLAVELVVRALVMTAALIVVGLTLEIALYSDSLFPPWLMTWLPITMPRIVVIGFAISLVLGMVTETGRLIGGPLLTSVVLGTYHRPVRKQLIVMFLDLANSTRLAETMGEVRVHDLITRFFFDIDEPIGDFSGRVHAYVGDEVIVSWPASDDPARNARCVACFFAVERKIAALARDYEAEFGLAPAFRAGMHAGPVVVSECGDAKRQLAYFGDTMNVGARLCEYCKTINRRLVVSDDLLRLMTVRDDWTVRAGERIAVRGRQERVEAHVIERRSPTLT
jgi:class 3 adenylate cyclase